MTGREDGYCGNWDPKELHANPKDFKKVETPPGKRTTLVVYPHGKTGFTWRCVECDELITTEKWERPEHICEVVAKESD